MTVRPLIEDWFPAPTVGAESLRERGASSALPPINFLHVWWARRPLTASRAAIVATLLPAWPSEDEATTDGDCARVRKELSAEFPGGEADYRAWFLKTLGILGDPVAARRAIRAAVAAGSQTEGNAYGYSRAFTVTPDASTVQRIRRLASLRADLSSPPTILDPFAGGGAIPFEAVRFGCHAIANELNPVATAILHGTVDLPARLGPQFAETIAVYGARWADRVRKRLAPYFPHAEPDERLAYIWAHTVPCPTSGRPTPLAPDFWLARGKAGRDVAVNLEADPTTGRVNREIVEGKHAAEWGNRSTYKHGAATSIWNADTTFGGDYIREHTLDGRMGEMLLAISATVPGRTGRQFRAPSDADLAAVEAAAAESAKRISQWEIDGLIPSEEIPFGTDTRPQQHGMLLWRQMFSPRQLLTAATALEEMRHVVTEARDELGEEPARALNLYLGFALDKSVDYSGMLSSWHSSRTTVRNTFDRHDFSFKWTFAEFDGASALLPWAVQQVADAYKGIANLAHRPAAMDADVRGSTEISMGSAISLDISSGSVDVVITDPPYFDNVMYAECSDYFYVWLKRSLRDTWPELTLLPLSDKEAEAVANKSLFEDVATHSGRGKRQPGTKTADDLADEHYERLLARSFAECHRVLKDDGVMTVMFTHKRVDAWDALGQALLEAGFSIQSSWPVHTESEHSLHQAKKNAAQSTILLTCRKRGDTNPAYWDDIRGEVATTARRAASEFAADGLTGIDLTLATFGPALSILSRNWPVFSGELDDDGNPELLRPDVALDLAREEVARLKKRGLLGGRDVEFDRVTDWYLLAWADFKAAEFPYDEARKLSIATHLELDDLAKEHGVIRAASGSVTLLTPAQRRTARRLDPEAGTWPTLVDALHALMLVYDEEGIGAARSWLDRTAKRDDQRFRDLVTAALRAIPRVRDKGELVRPEARTLKSLRAALFDDIPAPPEDEREQAQQLFDS